MERPLRPDLLRYASAALQELRPLLVEQGVPENGEYLASALGYLQEGKPKDAEKFGRIALELAWEELHIGDWKSVAMVWRDLYALSSLINAMCALNDNAANGIPRAIAILDKGILMGGPRFHRHFTALISELTTTSRVAGRSPSLPTPSPQSVKPAATYTVLPPPVIKEENRIGRVPKPSMEQFLGNYMKPPSKPIIITDAMKHWPALNRWRDVEYLREKAGLRVVPIEVGKTYLSAGWSQQLIPLSEFIDTFVLNADKAPAVGYVAQTRLFDQIPELRADIDTPQYCYLGEEDKEIAVNAWFGPGGTISPLHQDPHDNILAQAVGSKYIRLYDPKYTECVYPHEGKLLFNTSQVDIDAPDHSKFPRFAAAPCIECVLSAGEMLFIPKGWWHYVRSLEVSFSVSFWY